MMAIFGKGISIRIESATYSFGNMPFADEVSTILGIRCKMF